MIVVFSEFVYCNIFLLNQIIIETGTYIKLIEYYKRKTNTIGYPLKIKIKII